MSGAQARPRVPVIVAYVPPGPPPALNEDGGITLTADERTRVIAGLGVMARTLGSIIYGVDGNLDAIEGELRVMSRALHALGIENGGNVQEYIERAHAICDCRACVERKAAQS